MTRTPCALSLLLFATTSAAIAEDAEIRFGTPPGSTWSVDQELSLRHELHALAGVLDAGAGAEAWLLVKLKERFIDEVVEDRHGRPTKIRRTYRASEASQDEGDVIDTSLLDVTLLVVEKDDGSDVVAEKGSPDEDVLELLKRCPVDPSLALLPKKRVHQGQEWEVDDAAIGAFRGGMYADLLGAVDDEKAGEVAATLDTLAGAKLVAKVASLTEDEATIEFAGTSELGESKSLEIGGIKIEGTPSASVKMKGTLVFSLREGRPVRLEWTESRSATAAGKVSIPGLGTLGGAGARQDWKVVRTYAPIE